MLADVTFGDCLADLCEAVKVEGPTRGTFFEEIIQTGIARVDHIAQDTDDLLVVITAR